MQGIELRRRGDCFIFNGARCENLDFGICVGLHSPRISWDVALFGNEASCRELAGHIIHVDAKEIVREDLVDALKEMLNIVAGAFKRKLSPDESDSLIVGLPLFLSGADSLAYLQKGREVYCQRLSGLDANVDVIVIWKEEDKQ
jgi:hypothetical protein